MKLSAFTEKDNLQCVSISAIEVFKLFLSN